MKEITEEKLNDKLKEYINRNNFWSEKAINQFGYSLNLFTTIGIGLLGYLVTNREKFPSMEIVCCRDINWILVFYFSATSLTIFSIVFGFVAILSRLYDFRITRHLSLTRKRYLSRKKNKEGLFESKIIDISHESYFKSFKKNVFKEIDFINEYVFFIKFEQLRKDSKILGAIAWKMHRYQILFITSGLVLYGLTIMR